MSSLLTRINESHHHPTDSAVQQLVLRDAFALLGSLDASKHFFCDPEVQPAAIHALILTSFADSPSLVWYKSKASEFLSSCADCIEQFHHGRCRLMRTFLDVRKVPYSNVKSFNNIIIEWETERLSAALLNIYESSVAPSPSTVQKYDKDLTLFECLLSPEVFRNNSALLTLFSHIFTQSLASSQPWQPPKQLFFPALLYFIFQGSSELKEWTVNYLNDHYNTSDKCITAQDWSDIVAEEFIVHLAAVQEPLAYNNEQTVATFWLNFSPLLPLLLPDTIRDKLFLNVPFIGNIALPYTVEPVQVVLLKQLFARVASPLPWMLTALLLFLSKLSHEFWQIVQPNSFMNVLETVFVNKNYLTFLQTPIPSDAYYAFEDLLDWLPKLYATMVPNSTEKRLAGLRICQFLFSQSHDSVNKLTVFKMAIDFLADCSALANEMGSPLLLLELISKVECRQLINFHMQELFVIMGGSASSVKEEEQLRLVALKAVNNAVKYDVTYFVVMGYSLRENKTVNLPPVQFKADFWQLLVSYLETMSYGAVELLECLANVSHICKVDAVAFTRDHGVNLNDPKNSSLKVSMELYNTHVEHLFGKVSEVLDLVGAGDSSFLKSLLTQLLSASGFWSCMFSSNEKIYQSAANLLYNAFDVEGRLEGVQMLVKTELSVTLECLALRLPSVMRNGAFDLFPRAVRVLMDVVQSLVNPLDGLLINDFKLSSELKLALIKFWSTCWKFLDFSYRKTLIWAQSMSARLLIDFTRDTLDLSHQLINGYYLIKLTTGGDKLSSDIAATIGDIICWLKLGDISLLSSCVDLVFKTLDLADLEGVSLEDSTIELMARFGAKSKNYKSRLTEQQKMEILDRARLLNNDIVEKVVIETDKKKAALALALALAAGGSSASSSVEPDVIEIPERTPTPLALNYPANSSNRQSTLRDFLATTKAAPVAPPPKLPPLKNSLLQEAKLSLASKRSNLGKPTLPPAPPRPPGFNRARKQEQDSDSSDSDSENEVESLFRPDKKKVLVKKTTGVSLIHKKISVRPQKKQMDQKELDAHYMRLRLNTDLNPLYKHVLSWDYSRTHDFPEDAKNIPDLYRLIQDAIPNPEQYVNTFEPLLLLECWQGIQQSKQMAEETPFPVIVGSRSTTDSFFDIYASVRKEVLQDRKIGDADLVVLCFDLRSSTLLDQSPLAAIELLQGSKHSCLAKVKEIKSANPEISDVTFRVNSRNNPLTSFLTPRTELLAMKVMHMVTIEREYSSLKGLPYYDLCKQIVQAVPNKPESLSDKEKQKIRQVYNVNDSQAEAIVGSVKSSKGFSLIQGPPGTGKTKTIMGIVGYILTELKNSLPNAIRIPGSRLEPESKLKNILICAPSNAAVDELVLRLQTGIKNVNGDTFKPKVVRIGRPDAVNPAVRELTLEELVNRELEGDENSKVASSDPKIREEQNHVLAMRNKINNQLARDDLSSDEIDLLRAKLRQVIKRKNELGKQLDDQRELVSKSVRTREINRKQLQLKFLSEAQVICTTLSGSAHDVLSSLSPTFETVVVDEAAQCIELSAIIPLRYGCKKCIMVGDPNQLPPTVLSQLAASYSYEQSLFVRMQRQNPQSVYLLNVQYRMHPQISRFPSAQFYDSKLVDGPNMLLLTARPWHKNPAFSPYLFYDVVNGKQQQNQRSKSFFNPGEARIALEIVDKLFHEFPDENWTGRIGIISPYKQQVWHLKELLQRKYGRTILNEIDCNTIDGFQGQEKEIIIISCVRASELSGVGFLSDVRRMNVALTRSKSSLWILGSVSSLVQNKVWNNLIRDASERSVLYKLGPGSIEDARTFTQKQVVNIPEVKERKDRREDVRLGDRRSPGVSNNVENDKDHSRDLEKVKRKLEDPENDNVTEPSKLSKPSEPSKNPPKIIKRISGDAVEKINRPKNRNTVPFNSNKKKMVISAETLKLKKKSPPAKSPELETKSVKRTSDPANEPPSKLAKVDTKPIVNASLPPLPPQPVASSTNEGRVRDTRDTERDTRANTGYNEGYQRKPYPNFKRYPAENGPRPEPYGNMRGTNGYKRSGTLESKNSRAPYIYNRPNSNDSDNGRYYNNRNHPNPRGYDNRDRGSSDSHPKKYNGANRQG